MTTENIAFAKEAGLKYVRDSDPGYTRKRRGKGFIYFDHKKLRIKDKELLLRISKLVIPPAWQDVWICTHEDGHLQCTGRDARERKQYRYHSTWSQKRNEDKFYNLELFGSKLPRIRDQLKADLKRDTFSRQCVLATVVSIMERTHIRIGNDRYAEENKSYGLTTILNKHAEVHGSKIEFKFRGKSGVWREAKLSDRRLSHIVRSCQELPGQELFAYLENEVVHDVGSHDVNNYLREITEADITAKDFRTWAGTVTALEVLHKIGPLKKETKTARKSREAEVIKLCAQELGNTPAVCKKYYVYPKVFEADRNNEIKKLFQKAKKSQRAGLTIPEKALLQLLR